MKVLRIVSHRTVRMTRGDKSWEEPEFRAVVLDNKGQFVGSVRNSTLLCLPGRTIRGPKATDEEILQAVINDEPV